MALEQVVSEQDSPLVASEQLVSEQKAPSVSPCF
uniref:Uncharacterized protein n=1 Tax=Anguilla anguilla TaxID=7936 RepID=A0A0E9U8W6_ANGAN